MRKWLKGILLCLMMLALVGVFGCDDDKYITSVSMSIGQEYATQVEGSMPTYSMQYSTARVPLDVSISPSNFSVRDISFSSSNSTVAYVTEDGYIVTRGEGSVIIYAQYTTRDGSRKTVAIKLNVLITRVPSFKSSSCTLTFNGLDQSSDERLQVNDGSDEYEYYYLKYNEKTQRMEETASLRNAGEYTIKYRKKDDIDLEVAQMSLTIVKANVNIDANSISSKYLEDIESMTNAGVYYESSINYEASYIVSSLGEDAEQTIGQYYTVTTASIDSPVYTYATKVEYSLLDSFKDNYNIKTTPGSHIIEPLEVYLALDNQSIEYGSSLVRDRYSVYKYDGEIPDTPPSSSLLNLDMLIEVGDIYAGDYTICKDDNVVLSNEFGNIAVSDEPYEILFANAHSSANLIIKGVKKGELVVVPRPVTVDIVLPSSGYGKKHLEEDNLSGLTFSLGDNARFAREISSEISVDYGADDLGVGNRLAVAGEYGFAINDDSHNFILELSNKCKSGYEGDDKVVYTVYKAPIVVRFDELIAQYKKTSSEIPTVSYIEGLGFDYIVNLSYISVNGDNILTDYYKSDTFDIDGYFVISAEGSSQQEKFRINTAEVKPVPDYTGPYYKSYIVSYSFSPYDTRYAYSYELKCEPSMLQLTKRDVTYYLDNELSSCVFSGLSKETESLVQAQNYINNILLYDEDLSVDDILQEERGLLSISYKNKQGLDVYLMRKDATSNYEEVTTFGNVGQYKIFVLNSSETNYIIGKGVDHFNFVLDDSREYVFTINKRDVVITPNNYSIENNDNVKIYGDSDKAISYTLEPSPIDNLPLPADQVLELLVSGNLKRESGENVGEYRINSIGSLKFEQNGYENYNLILSTTDNKYKIMPREMQIVPYSTSITYGQSYPIRDITSSDYDIKIEITKGVFESVSRISNGVLPNLILPTHSEFSGEFKLSTDGMTSSEKIGGYYPVLIEQGEVKAYSIIYGQEDSGFRYIGHIENGKTYYNYNLVEMSENDIPTCVIEPRQAIISFIPTTIKDLNSFEENDGYYTLYLDQSSGKYNITGLTANVSGTSFTLKAQFDNIGGYLFLASIDDVVSKVISIGDQDVTDCYTISLASKKIYNIDSEIVSVVLMSVYDDTNAVTEVYDGNSKRGVFKLSIVGTNTERLEITKESADNIILSTDIESGGIIFTSGGESTFSPINYGNYVVSLMISEKLPLVINRLDEDDNVISTMSFTSFDTKQDKYMLDFSSFSFLTITKADIIMPDNVSFDGEFVYGMTKNDMPSLILNDGEEHLFKDNSGHNIYLKHNDDGINYSLGSNILIQTLPTGNQEIRIVVEATKYYNLDGEEVCVDELSYEEIQSKIEQGELVERLDTNYNSLEINTTIKINHKKINIEDYNLKVGQEV